MPTLELDYEQNSCAFFSFSQVEEQAKPDEEKEEVVVVDEAPSTRHAVNMYHCVLATHKSIVEKQLLSDHST